MAVEMPDTPPLLLASLRGPLPGHKGLLRPLPLPPAFRPFSLSDSPYEPIRRAGRVPQQPRDRWRLFPKQCDRWSFLPLILFPLPVHWSCSQPFFCVLFRVVLRLPHVPSLPRDRTLACCHRRFRIGQG